jgi:DNA-binding response OmpR family regulator/tetratricopeptide (TPR) repeat protein
MEEDVILVVEPGSRSASGLSCLLRSQSDLAAAAADPSALEEALASIRPRLILVDLDADDTRLEALSRALATVRVPVIVVLPPDGAVPTDLRRVATDTLVRPFSQAALLARIERILRSNPPRKTHLAVGELEVDRAGRQARFLGRPLDLTPREFDLLCLLAEHPGWVFGKEQLFEQVWGYTYVGDTRVVPVHMGNLRRKLERAGGHDYLQTVRGAGYRLQAKAGTESPAPRRRAEPLVGRVEPLGRLRQAYEETWAAGRGRAVLIWGESGIGKTSLADAFGSWASEDGAVVLWGRCLDDEITPSYWPWTQILRAWWETSRGSKAERLFTPYADRLRSLSGGDPGSPVAPTPAGSSGGLLSRFWLFDSMTSFLRGLYPEQRVVLVLDDLQGADAASLALLAHLVRDLKMLPLLLVTTCQEVELRPDSPLSGVVAALVREASGERIVLRGLLREEVAELATFIAGREAPEPLVDVIMRETDGNPFYVTQVVRLLLEQGEFEWPPGRRRLPGIPDGVVATVNRRLASLSDESREVLLAGTVEGRIFSISVVSAVTGIEGERLVAALDEAIAARFLLAEPDEHLLHFRHNLTREALYESLGVAERMRLHAQVGLALEAQQAGDEDQQVEELAHHFQRAAPLGYVDRALTNRVRAAQRALARLAWEDARSQLRQASALLPQAAGHLDPNGPLQAVYWETLADIEAATGGHAQARHAYGRSLAHRPSGPPADRARLRRKAAKTYLEQGTVHRAIENLHKALAEIGPLSADSEEDLWQAWLEAKLDMMWAAYYSSDVAALSRLLLELGPIVQERASAVQLSAFRRCRLMAVVAGCINESDERLTELARAMMDAAHETGLPGEIALSAALLSLVLTSKRRVSPRDLAEAEDHQALARRLAEEVGDGHAQVLALAERASRRASQDSATGDEGTPGPDKDLLAVEQALQLIKKCRWPS